MSVVVMLLFFFFKQKTAYEMRISDWSSDVCSSDLTERERSHIDIVALAIAGRSREALKAALTHSDRWPRDVVILSLPLGAFGLFAFSGMADHDQARVDLCQRHAAHFTDRKSTRLNSSH